MSDKQPTYLEERVYQKMRLTPEQCAVPLFIRKDTPAVHAVRKFKDKNGKDCEEWKKDKDGKWIAAPFPLFQSDKDDGIRMYPYTLDGELITYRRDKQPKYSDGEVEDFYFVTRRNPKWLEEHKNYPKYDFPGGDTKKGTYPFFPPTLYEKYQKGEHIDTLVLTEGYLKAMDASVHGMNVVGLGSITLFADSKTKQLYPDITKLILRCQPNNIVILYDGDCLDISKDAKIDLANNRIVDVAGRPMQFRAALTKLRELLLEFKNCKGEPCNLYFSYVLKQDVENPPKGLDDLIDDERFQDKVADIAEDLNFPNRPGAYFFKFNLSVKAGKISEVFGLTSPEKFYETHEDEIDPPPAEGDPINRKRHLFKYGGGIYQYSLQERKLVQQLDCNLDDYIAVGGEIVLVTEEPIANAQGTEWKFFSKPDKVINARYGEKTAQKIYKYRYYEDYTIKPCNDQFEKEIINAQGYKFYNMYSPCPYKAEEGKWPTIEKLLRQITKVYPEEQYHYYEMLLDYFTIMWFDPFQFLPIIMLVSKERGTGKTSFLNLGKFMFGRNAVIGGNDLVCSKFNSSLAGKILVGVDESCLGDNKEVGESLKYMSTTRTMHIEMKGKDKKEMPAFVKFVLCSNEVKKGVFVGKDEIRFWVMRLTPWEDNNYDVEFDDKLETEIPAFLWFLSERWNKNQMFVPVKEHRMWFSPARLQNDDLFVLMSGTQSNFESSLCEFLENMFLDTKKRYLYFDTEYILDNLRDTKRKDSNYIVSVLSDMKGVRKIKESGKYKMPFRITKDMIEDAEKANLTIPGDEGEVIWPKKSKQARPWCFDAAYFVEPDVLPTLHGNDPNESGTGTEEEKKQEPVAPKSEQQAQRELFEQVNNAAKQKWPDLPAQPSTDPSAKVDDDDDNVF